MNQKVERLYQDNEKLQTTLEEVNRSKTKFVVEKDIVEEKKY